MIQISMRLSKDTWDQIKAGHAAGIGLRELARNMNVPEGTVLARAKREGWTQQIEAAKHAAALTQSNAITPMQSIAAVMQERGERYRERIAGVSERVVSHVEAMCPDETSYRLATAPISRSHSSSEPRKPSS
jgi:IS30 family transposase